MREGDEFQVVNASNKHIEGMVRCHGRAFGGEFLTLLGPWFLRALYRCFVNHPEGIAAVVVDGRGEVRGLVVGGAPSLQSRFLRHHAGRFLAAALCKMWRHARVRRRLAEHATAGLRAIGRKLRLVRRSTEPEPVPDAPGRWSNLLSICTDPDWRGRGLGRRLMEAYRIESQRQGYRTMRLSVHNDNDGAIALYRRCGWTRILTVPQGTYFSRTTEEGP